MLPHGIANWRRTPPKGVSTTWLIRQSVITSPAGRASCESLRVSAFLGLLPRLAGTCTTTCGPFVCHVARKPNSSITTLQAGGPVPICPCWATIPRARGGDRRWATLVLDRGSRRIPAHDQPLNTKQSRTRRRAFHASQSVWGRFRRFRILVQQHHYASLAAGYTAVRVQMPNDKQWVSGWRTQWEWPSPLRMDRKAMKRAFPAWEQSIRPAAQRLVIGVSLANVSIRS